MLFDFYFWVELISLLLFRSFLMMSKCFELHNKSMIYCALFFSFIFWLLLLLRQFSRRWNVKITKLNKIKKYCEWIQRKITSATKWAENIESRMKNFQRIAANCNLSSHVSHALKVAAKQIEHKARLNEIKERCWAKNDTLKILVGFLFFFLIFAAVDLLLAAGWCFFFYRNI